MKGVLSGIKAVFVDLDGTLILGSTVIDGAVEFIEKCREKNILITFLSNNSSLSVNEYFKKLTKLGFIIEKKEILLSTHDLIREMKKRKINDCWLIGTFGMKEMLESEDISTNNKEAKWVVLGYDTELTYDKLSQGIIMMNGGAKLIASHPDMVCPSPNGNLPDVGSMLTMIEKTTNKSADIITGKPRPDMILNHIKYLGVRPNQCAMIGDRLYTDMVMAKRAECLSILVLSGETNKENISQLSNDMDMVPDIIVDSIADLI